MTKDLSWFSVCLQVTPTLLQAMEYSVHRLVLAAVASRHKVVNEHCRHLSESQTIPAPKGSSSYTAGNFLWLQHPDKETSVQDYRKSKNTTSHRLSSSF